MVPGGRGEVDVRAVLVGRRALAGQFGQCSPASVYCGQWRGMSQVEPNELTDEQIEAVLRQAIASVTEQACANGWEGDVMEALFPVVFPGVGDDDGEDLGL